MEHYPVIVIGGGTMGTAAAWALGRRGVEALVLERFRHVHHLGSHGGKTRVIRHAYAEGSDYVPLVLRADDLWCALEEESGRSILRRTGMLEVGVPGFTESARAAQAAAVEHGLAHEWLSGTEIRRRWPAWTLGEDWEGLYEERSGFLVVEPALGAMAEVSRRLDVVIREEEPVRGWRVDGSGVSVETNVGTYHADRLIVAAGPWAAEVLAGLGLPLVVLRKVLFWLAVQDRALFEPEVFPVFGISSADSAFYGLPVFEHEGVKVAEHLGGEPTDPDRVERTVRPDEVQAVVPMAQRAFRGVVARAIDHAVCLYTMTPDEDFIVDRHPEWPHVVVAAGFSGHGFKFAPAIGEHLAALALDSEARPYPRFALTRFAPPSP